MKHFAKLLICFSLILVVSSCTILQEKKSEIYPMSFDQTYNVVMSALDDMPDWQLVTTNQTRGMFVVGIGKYPIVSKEVTFIVERVSPFQTKVRFYNPWEVSLFDPDFFDVIDQYMGERADTYPS